MLYLSPLFMGFAAVLGKNSLQRFQENTHIITELPQNFLHFFFSFLTQTD